MASKTLHAHDYPIGTVVSAYPREALTDGAPSGTAVDSSQVASDGSLQFDGLTEGRRYVAYALGRPVFFFMEKGSLDKLGAIRGQEASDARDLLAGVSVSKEAPLNMLVSRAGLADVQRDGTVEDSAALQARLDLIAAAGGGAGYLPGGPSAYIAYNLQPDDNTEVFGDAGTVVKMPPNAPLPAGMTGRFLFVNKDKDTTGNSKLRLHDMTLDGNVASNQANENYFALALNSVQDVRAYNLRVQNIRGDAGYVTWNGMVESSDVHFRNITLSNVGVVAGGGVARQGVSFIQCRRGSVRDITGQLIGAYVVDLEPNFTTDVLEDITVEGVHGYDCQSGVNVTPAAAAQVSSTGDTTSGGTTITNVSPTTGWQNGMSVSGPGVPRNTIVLSGAGTSTLTLSGRVWLTQTGGTFKGINTRRIHVDDVSVRDGPTAVLQHVVSVGKAQEVTVGGRVSCDVPVADLATGREIWLEAAAMPPWFSCVAQKTQIQSRPASFTVQPNTGTFLLSGTGPVSSGNVSWTGHKVVFQVANGVTFVDGSNLKLNAGFAPLDDNSAITLLYNGTNWVEVARSVNGA